VQVAGTAGARLGALVLVRLRALLAVLTHALLQHGPDTLGARSLLMAGLDTLGHCVAGTQLAGVGAGGLGALGALGTLGTLGTLAASLDALPDESLGAMRAALLVGPLLEALAEQSPARFGAALGTALGELGLRTPAGTLDAGAHELTNVLRTQLLLPSALETLLQRLLGHAPTTLGALRQLLRRRLNGVAALGEALLHEGTGTLAARLLVLCPLHALTEHLATTQATRLGALRQLLRRRLNGLAALGEALLHEGTGTLAARLLVLRPLHAFGEHLATTQATRLGALGQLLRRRLNGLAALGETLLHRGSGTFAARLLVLRPLHAVAEDLTAATTAGLGALRLLVGGRLSGFAALGHAGLHEHASPLGAGLLVVHPLEALAQDGAATLGAGGRAVQGLLFGGLLRPLAVVRQALVDELVSALPAGLLVAAGVQALRKDLPATAAAGLAAGDLIGVRLGLRVRLGTDAALFDAALQGEPHVLGAAALVIASLGAAGGRGGGELLAGDHAGVGVPVGRTLGALGGPFVQALFLSVQATRVLGVGAAAGGRDGKRQDEGS